MSRRPGRAFSAAIALLALGAPIASIGVGARADGPRLSGGRPIPSASAGPAVGPETPSIPDVLPSADAYAGKPIASIAARVRGSMWTTPPALQGPKAGDKLDVAAARKELARILDDGGFASGALEVTEVDGGVAVVYRLVPARFVRRVSFRGNALPDEEVRRAAGLVDVPDVTERSLDVAARAITAYYLRRGWPKARVEIVTIESDAPNTVVVDVRVEPGTARTVESRTFHGLPSWDAAAVAAGNAYAVTNGSRGDDEQLEAADRELASKLRGAGFVNATVTHALVPRAPASADDRGTAFDLTVTVVAGAKYVPAFDGNVVFDEAHLRKVLDLANEPDRSSYHLASKIEDAYQRRGYFDAKVTPELLGAVEDRQRTLMLHVREGGLVTVSGRVYPCLHGALDQKRLDREIDSYLDEELESGGFGEIDVGIGDALVSGRSDVSRGAVPTPVVPDARRVFVPSTYARALEHLRELYKSEGYMFAEIGEPRLVRAACKKTSPAGQCVPEAIPELPDVCRRDADLLPLEAAPYPKALSCAPDPVANVACAPSMQVAIPIDPGPRSLLWDVAFDGALQMTPAKLGSKDLAGGVLRPGQPLSLNDVEAARQKIVDAYRDDGFAFAVVKATIEYSPDKSRARVRYLVSEGEQVVVDEIRIEGLNQTRESLVRDRLLLTPGGVYRASWVRDSIDRLNKLGVFASVSVGLANPTIPAKRKTVVVTLAERKPNAAEFRVGYSSGQGARLYGEYSYNNLFGYAVNAFLRAQLSYQPFLFESLDLYDKQLRANWESQSFGNRIARRISVGVSLPHTPYLPNVRTTLEFVNVLDLWRDFRLNKINPFVLTFAWEPARWFYATLSSDIENNNFVKFGSFDSLNLSDAVKAQLHLPAGDTTITAQRIAVTFDFRDVRLGATKGGFLSLSSEWVKNLTVASSGERQDFLHLSGAAGYYQRLFPWSGDRHVVLALELAGGLNRNVFSCAGEGASSTICNTYPDRLFYIGGPDSHRGYLLQQMLPQEVLDLNGSECTPDPTTGVIDPTCIRKAVDAAPHGGNLYFNPRAELRIPAFGWGGFVFFVDAANLWRDPANFKPWKLRYAIGPGLSLDTPIGPVAADFGFNLAPKTSLGEPTWQFNFSIGRF